QVALAQTGISDTSADAASNVLWHLVRYSAVLDPGSGLSIPGVTGMTFSLYSQPEGGAALWIENQNIPVDNQGHYTVLLGAASPDGIPAELFASGQARWLGIQIFG